MKISVCKFCASPINRKRTWQEFCSDTCRWRYWNQEHPRTKTDAKIKDSIPCYYCGLPASTIDHVPPKTIRERLRVLNLVKRYPFHEVQSCFECNIALGARALLTPQVRKQFIKSWIRKRYKRLLRIPVWSDRDLSELGYVMQSSVLSSILAAEVTRARLEW